MRILLGTQAELKAELGAGQAALNLSQEWRKLGHEVTVWTPHPLPAHRFWRTLPLMRRKLDEFLAANGPWDLIDLPPMLVTARARTRGLVVAREIQPDVEYIKSEFYWPRRLRQFFTYPVHQWNNLNQILKVQRGQKLAHRVLILGSTNLEAALRKSPWLAGKSGVYYCAIHTPDRAAFRRVRESRTSGTGKKRFLWIGRWAANKNPELLLDVARGWKNEPANFTVAGCGQAGVEAVKNHGLSDLIRVLPNYSRSELPGILAEHDAGIFTSKVEGWGISLNEMLEAGMRIFATEAGGVNDLREVAGEALQPLTNLKQAPLILPKSRIDWEAYDRLFTWPGIAQDYFRAIRIAEKQ